MNRQQLRDEQRVLSMALLARRELLEQRINSGRYRISPLALVLSAAAIGVLVQMTGINSRHVLAMGLG